MSEVIANRSRHVLAAWLVGCAIYMLLAIEVWADAGLIAIPFQITIGAVCSWEGVRSLALSLQCIYFTMCLGIRISKASLWALAV